MSDYISRSETIDWLKRVTVTEGITFETGFAQILHDIEQMPSVDRWIPCNEQLPENGRWVIYCDKDGIVGDCPYWNGFNKFERSNGDCEMTDIVAWMYSPEPFKGVSEC